MSIDAAIQRARAAAAHPPEAPGVRLSRLPRRTIAIGDPQASLERFFEILQNHRLLAGDGSLVQDVHLVSIGDHFDWGTVAERDRAAADGLAILAWLASHAPEQVTLIVGNHDLARVGELQSFDDDSFARIQAEADALYHRAGGGDPEAETRFRQAHPQLPSVEAAARDFSTFRRDQRDLVRRLLEARRFSVAAAGDEQLLFCHAGVTRDQLARLGLPTERRLDARPTAEALNAALDQAFDAWDGASAFSIPGLHVPGSAAHGEARGIFVHRPANPELERASGSARQEDYAGALARRYDPRGLPTGLTQAIGHIRDKKSRALLGPWAVDSPGDPGQLRHLSISGEKVSYANGVPNRESEPALIFIDGSMREANPHAYELFAADRFGPARV